MVVLAGLSAWEYWRTPPLLRDAFFGDKSVLPEGRDGSFPMPELPGERRSWHRIANMLNERRVGILKGVTLPMHVLVEYGCNRRKTAGIELRSIPKWLPLNLLEDLGGGLFVLPVELAAMHDAKSRGVAKVALDLYEACGIYSSIPDTPALASAIRLARDAGAISPEASRRSAVAHHRDAQMRLVSQYDDAGEPREWMPAFDRFGEPSGIWKHPPLTTLERIRQVRQRVAGMPGGTEVDRALGCVLEGAASPAEARACLLLCSGTFLGGEEWPKPQLNVRIAYAEEARRLAGARSCVADALWPDGNILEVHGEAFHADRAGFRSGFGRTAALESMGHTVAEVTYSQLADYDQLETIIPVIAAKFGYRLKQRTPAFIKRRKRLHEVLFGAGAPGEIR